MYFNVFYHLNNKLNGRFITGLNLDSIKNNNYFLKYVGTFNENEA